MPEHAKVGNAVDAPAFGIEAHDGAGREDISEKFSANQFEFVEPGRRGGGGGGGGEGRGGGRGRGGGGEVGRFDVTGAVRSDAD